MHYIPKDGVYVYFRYDDAQTIMCVMNTNETEKEVDLGRFNERLNGFSKMVNAVNKAEVKASELLKIEPMQMLILELVR